MKTYTFNVIFGDDASLVTYKTNDNTKILFLDSFLKGYKKRDCEILSGNVLETNKKKLNLIYDKYNDWSDMLNVIIDKNHLALDNLYPEFGTYRYDTCDFIESFMNTVYDIFKFDILDVLDYRVFCFGEIDGLIIN